MHGGGPEVKAGAPLNAVYKEEALDLVRAGCSNLCHHIRNVRKFGVIPVVAINRFSSDTQAELDAVAALALEAGAFSAPIANHWAEGGKGATDLAQAVIDACAAARSEPSTFRFLYPLEMGLKEKITTITSEMYNAAEVTYSELAEERIAKYTEAGYANLPICMAKTQYSLSTDASVKGAPSGHTVHVKDIRASVGAGYIYPICGDIMTVPGLAVRPGFYDVDLDLDTGRVIGLF